MNHDVSQRLVFVFLPQVSPDAETCVRCAQLARPAEIEPGTAHFAMIEDRRQLDTAARVILCKLCDFFIRDALESQGHDADDTLPA